MSRKPPSISPSVEKLQGIKVLQNRVFWAKETMTDANSSDLLMERICLKQSLLLIYMQVAKKDFLIKDFKQNNHLTAIYVEWVFFFSICMFQYNLLEKDLGRKKSINF